MSNYYRPGGVGGFSFFPPVIKNLLIINVVVFFVQMLMEQITFGGYPGWYIVNKWFALNPISGFDPAGRTFNFQVWQLITYQFMHGGFFHIFFNMLMLWMFGMEVENMWGSRKFLYFYLLCGIVAGLFHLFLTPLLGLSNSYVVGASGAIMGVLIAFGMLFPDRYIFLYFLLPIKAKYLILIMVLLNLFAVNSADGVARLAHLGGAVAGFLFIMLDKNSPVDLKAYFRRTRRTTNFTKSGNFQNPFRRKKTDIQEADYHDINSSEDAISQQEIDKILDKISQSGYQNLTEREKRILFEASKKMK